VTEFVRVPYEKLPVLLTGPRSPLWWAFILLITIEIAVFSTLISSYLYLRFTAPVWPPGGIEPPSLPLPLANSFVLFASSLAVYWADRGIKKGDVRRLKIGMGLGILLGVIFLILKVVEYADVDYYWDTHAYGSIIWAMILFHSMHVGAVVAKGCVMEYLAFQGYFTDKRHLGVDVNGVYWHFVALVWIPLFIVIYLVPRW
jgi:cytochrome c oxidase subunit III